MNDNPIVAEVRAARKEILDSYNGDVQAMLRDMMKKQYERGREFLSLPHEGKNEEVGPASNDTVQAATQKV